MDRKLPLLGNLLEWNIGVGDRCRRLTSPRGRALSPGIKRTFPCVNGLGPDGAPCADIPVPQARSPVRLPVAALTDHGLSPHPQTYRANTLHDAQAADPKLEDRFLTDHSREADDAMTDRAAWRNCHDAQP